MVVAELVLEELYKSSAATQPIFQAVNMAPEAPGDLFSAQEAGIAVVTYAKNQGLEQNASSPANLVLDTILCDALFKVGFS